MEKTGKGISKYLFILSFVSLMLLFIALNFSFAKDMGPIKIGSLQPTTGVASWLGQQTERGFKLALEEYGNEVAGRKIKVIYSDTEGIPEVALTKAKRLIQKNGVHMLFGPFLSHTEAPVIEHLRTQGWLPIIAPGGGEIERFVNTSFNISGHFSDEGITVPFARYAYEKMGWRKAIVLANDYLWGHEVLKAFSEGFEKAGGTVVEKIFVPLNTMDMTPYLDKIKAKADQADFVWDFIIVGDSVRFHRQFVDAGLKLPRWSNGEGVTSPGLIAQTGMAAVGAYGIFTWVYETRDLFPTAKKFTDSFFNKYKIIADYFAACGYQGGKFIWRALKNIDGKAEDREALLAAIKGVRLPKKDNVYRDAEFYFDKEWPFPIVDGYVCIVEEVDGKPKLKIIDVIKNIPPKLL